MKVREIMERAGLRETGRALAYIKDALEELNLISENTPPSMAAGCIYLYIKHNELEINKKEL